MNRVKRSTTKDSFCCFKCGDGNTPLYCMNCATALNNAELADMRDWLSPEVREKFRAVLADVLPRFGCPNCTNEYCAECDVIYRRINEAMALLDKEDAK